MQDRKKLIEENVRALSLAALERGESWATQLGRPPAAEQEREAWLRRLDTVSAYRERWHVHVSVALGPGASNASQVRERNAAEAALTVVRPEGPGNPANAHVPLSGGGASVQ